MIVGLHDAELEHIKNKTFPNLALMKISAYHKSLKDSVEWWEPIKQYDKVYSSKVFDFTKKNNYLPADTIKGGTGYDVKKVLDKQIDDVYPDYSIYPYCDYAIGFLTRGCIRNCEWCVVPDKEGKIKEYRKWQDIVRKDTNKLVLMDNNILASDYGVSQLESLATTNIKIDLNQGMDIRLVTKDIVKIFKHLNWIKYIRFSCDRLSELNYFRKVINWFKYFEIPLSKIFVYVLVRKDLQDADTRVQTLLGFSKNINLYAQAERNEGLKIIPNNMQIAFSQRYVYGRLYKKETWNEYIEKRLNAKCRI